MTRVLVVGAGNAGLCAAIAARGSVFGQVAGTHAATGT